MSVFLPSGEVEVLGGRDITSQKVADADALLVRSITPVNEQLLSGSRVRFVGTATIGFDHVDLAYLERNGIGFASAPGSNANSAAEYVIAALLEIGRRHNIRLEGKSIGVIGVGNVGSRVARKCEALGMHVLRNDPPLQRQTGDPQYVPLEALYDCDFITIHTPLTREGIDKTFHLADAGFFSSLKPGAVFLNASRGAVVDSPALQQAIRAGRLRAVVLDVWEDEPDIDTGLLEMVDLGTPHIAGYSYDGKVAGMIMIYNALCAHFHLPPTRKIEDFLPRAGGPEAGPRDRRRRATKNCWRGPWSRSTASSGMTRTCDKSSHQPPKNAAGSSTICGSTIPFGASSTIRRSRSTRRGRACCRSFRALASKRKGDRENGRDAPMAEGTSGLLRRLSRHGNPECHAGLVQRRRPVP